MTRASAAQLVEFLPVMREVMGSSPTTGTFLSFFAFFLSPSACLSTLFSLIFEHFYDFARRSGPQRIGSVAQWSRVWAGDPVTRVRVPPSALFSLFCSFLPILGQKQHCFYQKSWLKQSIFKACSRIHQISPIRRVAKFLMNLIAESSSEASK